jgi:tryptophan synthase alpha subunit
MEQPRARVGQVADAVVIGSRIVQEIADAPNERRSVPGRIVEGFKRAMNA